MKQYLAIVLLVVFATSSAVADALATSYYIVRTEDIKKILPASGELSDLGEHDLEELSVASGYFLGSCNLYMKTSQFQLYFKFSEDSLETGGKKVFLQPNKGAFKYDLKMYSQESGKDIFRCSGNVDIGSKLSSGKDWDKNTYTVLFKHVNLKN